MNPYIGEYEGTCKWGKFWGQYLLVATKRYPPASSISSRDCVGYLTIGIYPKWDVGPWLPWWDSTMTKSHLCLCSLQTVVKETIYAIYMLFTAMWGCVKPGCLVYRGAEWAFHNGVVNGLNRVWVARSNQFWELPKNKIMSHLHDIMQTNMLQKAWIYNNGHAPIHWCIFFSHLWCM